VNNGMLLGLTCQQCLLGSSFWGGLNEVLFFEHSLGVFFYKFFGWTRNQCNAFQRGSMAHTKDGEYVVRGFCWLW
jgi:hypothetical protein